LDTYTRDISIKWPNDIYYKDKKIAGILIENNITGKILSRAVAGIGINVNQAVFHSDAPNPVSLKQITGMETDLNELLEQISCAVLSRYQQLKDGETNRITEDYHRALYRKAGFYPYKAGETSFLAKIESVANDGFLHLITEEGERRCYAFKEVRFVAQNHE
jgi:BirA family biotin operon repressor/biotin-[acetyl-CoA-carboxylase] ligase